MKHDPSRRIAAEILHAALKAADPYDAVKAYSDQIRSLYQGKNCRTLFLVGFGKAACSMARAVADLAGDLLTEGIVITKDGHAPQAEFSDKITIYEAGHPLPDIRGVRATEKVMDLLRGTDERTLVLFLISGGGSSLLVSPHRDITLQEKQRVTQLLLRAGAGIRELNTVRKHLSRIKGGRLAEIAYPANVLSLIVSDVIGDPLDVIASGPTAPDQSTFGDALDVIRRYDLADRLSEKVHRLLMHGVAGRIPETPEASNPAFARVQNVIVGSNRTAIDMAAKEAARRGYRVEILSTELQGEARNVGRWLARKALAARRETLMASQGKICLISGVETTVTVRGDGRGGRNMELALAFAREIKAVEGITLLSAGTDGTDGPTDAAGAFADGGTIARAEAEGLDPETYLWNNDSYSFFKAIDGLLGTGPTGTNIMDLQMVLMA